MIHRVLSVALLAAALGCAGDGGVGDIINRMGLPEAGLSDGTIISGLKQALEVGTRSAVDQTSQVNGYFDNPLIRIPLPGTLDTMAKGLRAIGFGDRVDELELQMNRAAEQAAGEATDVFWNAIRQMTFADARAILQGNDTAATDFFERTTRGELAQRFEPIVTEKVGQVGLARLYDDLTARYAALPFASKPTLNLSDYVTGRALDGLFTVLGEEERKIRTDPAARSTALLQRVFGSVGSGS